MSIGNIRSPAQKPAATRDETASEKNTSTWQHWCAMMCDRVPDEYEVATVQ